MGEQRSITILVPGGMSDEEVEARLRRLRHPDESAQQAEKRANQVEVESDLLARISDLARATASRVAILEERHRDFLTNERAAAVYEEAHQHRESLRRRMDAMEERHHATEHRIDAESRNHSTTLSTMAEGLNEDFDDIRSEARRSYGTLKAELTKLRRELEEVRGELDRTKDDYDDVRATLASLSD